MTAAVTHHDVFISYSRRDQAFVQRLHDALQQDDLAAWVDWADIAKASGWWLEVERRLESDLSAVCQKEINYVVRYNKRLIQSAGVRVCA